ncbi:MAG TPA: hypothetical protein VGD91_26365 [Trebonia sp.]
MACVVTAGIGAVQSAARVTRPAVTGGTGIRSPETGSPELAPALDGAVPEV